MKQTSQPVQSVSGEDLLAALQLASSQDVQAMQMGSEQFKRMREMTGVHDGLHEIALRKDLPIEIRKMAAVQFKNLVVSHWRARRNLPEDHRARIRARALSFLNESDDTIAQCNEVATAKIARQDFPREWPTLITQLSQHIQVEMEQSFANVTRTDQHILPLTRALSLLNGVIKELASVKMMPGIKNMSQVFSLLHGNFESYYTALSNKILSQNITPEVFLTPVMHTDILLCHLSHKIMSKLAAWMWGRIDRLSGEEASAGSEWVARYFQSLTSHVPALLALRSNVLQQSQDHPNLERLTRLILASGKFFLRLQKLAAARFAQLPECANIVQFYWSQVDNATSSPENYVRDSGNAVYPIRFLVQGMQLFKDSLHQWAPTLKNQPNPNALPQPFVESAVKALITRFMRFSQKDLANWEEDPETWYNTEETENEQWQFEIRACSERVLMVLCGNFPDYTFPVIYAAFQETLTDTQVDLPSILKKEAFYCALGRCSTRLWNKIPYQQWLDEKASLEAKDPTPSYLIIKRRIAWLIGTLVSNSCISPNSSTTWETLVLLLKDSNSDLAVKLTAASSIGDCVGGDGFEVAIVAPYLSHILTEFMSLMSECTTLEVRRRINFALVKVLEECGEAIVPHMAIIADAMPQLWLDAGDQWVWKGCLLELAATFVNACKAASISLGNIVVPLIQDSLAAQSISQLDDDALKLWSSALRNTSSIQSVGGSRALIELFPGIIELLSNNMDLVGSTLSIIESYFLLDPVTLLQNFASPLFSAFVTGLTNDMVLVNKRDMIDAICLIVQLAPLSTWAEPLHTSGLFTHLLTSLSAGEREAILLTHYIYLFSRIILADRAVFLQLMTATAVAQNVQETTLYEGLLNQWWSRFDNMSEPRNRKLTAMGIAALVSTGRSEVLARLSTEIFNIWMDVFSEIKEASESAEGDSLEDAVSPLNLRRLWELDEPHPSWYAGTEGTPEFGRRQLVYEQDPVRNTKLTLYVSQRLQEAEANCPPPGLQAAYLADADPTVLSQIQKELKDI